MFEIIVAGGWMMLPIILCSIVTIAIVVERFWTLNSARLVPRHLLANVWSWIKNNQIDAAKLRELKQSSALGQILAAGLSNSKHGREVMKESIQEAASQVIHQMEKYVGMLGTIAAIAPLMGLLGTVFGMMKIFSAIMLEGGGGNTSALAGGISEALITTAAGLVVAIPAMMAHRFFLRRIDGIVVTMEEEAIKLVDALHSDRRVDVQLV